MEQAESPNKRRRHREGMPGRLMVRISPCLGWAGPCRLSHNSGGRAASERPLALRPDLAAGVPFAETGIRKPRLWNLIIRGMARRPRRVGFCWFECKQELVTGIPALPSFF